VLLKLEQEGAITPEWGASENNHRVRFYRLTREGRKRLQVETQAWEQTTAIIGRFFEAKRRICHEIFETVSQPCGQLGDQADTRRSIEGRD
jgi:DNA-binding PadR family transcriptional regulator